MDFLRLIRPANCLFAALCVLFGAFYLNRIYFDLSIFSAVLSAGLIAAAGYVINDFFDIPLDKVNKPYRVLPSGRIKPSSAYLFAVILFIIGISCSFATGNWYCCLIALSNSIMLFYYARYFKLRLLSGNLIVSYTAASTFIFGAICADNLINIIPVAVMAFLYTLIREIIKDAEDIEGDRKFGARTLAVRLERKTSILLTLLPALALTAFFFLIFHRGLINLYAYLLLTIFVSLPLLIILVQLIRNCHSQEKFQLASRLIKLDMLILLIIIWIGQYHDSL
ncbi:MAG: geranylgeranylglycerol-phosphate geranylgeranyltransferase [Candidatus Cloacimonetes bacterium]|nr:geranylgeranylglycerol-phosphate geranylgeranyltransferase [Candidatus Cloacimonadota bacterium]